MKIALSLLVLILMASCGSGEKGSGQPKAEVSPLESKLTPEEEKVAGELVQKGELSQKELLKFLLLLKKLDEASLGRLDRVIEVSCHQGLCLIRKKD